MTTKEKITLGWREWGSLPELNILAIKVKIDTGAKTSALHAFDIEAFQKNQKEFLRFKVHPKQNDEDCIVHCEAPIVEQRQITNSGGHKEMRYVIETKLVLANKEWPIEITLTSRRNMRFRMLLGRRAMVDYALVDPSASYLCGKLKNKI